MKERRIIRGNEPILLDEPTSVWVVRSGSAALFLTAIEAGKPRGSRHFLFEVNGGEIFSGMRSETVGLLAVPLEVTTLEFWEIEATDRFDNWIEKLCEFIAVSVPTNCQIWEPGSQFLSVLKDRGLSVRTGLIWVRVRQGEMECAGMTFTPDSPPFPLTPKLGVVAKTLTEVQIRSTADLEEASELAASLSQFHALWLTHLGPRISDTPDIPNPRPPSSPLVRAVEAVVSTPIRLSPQVGEEETAIAHQFRIRQVTLPDDWWRGEYGPLLASASGHPAALLPRPGGGYRLFDPEADAEVVVDGDIARTVSAEAYQFYPPLPPSVGGAIAIARFSLGKSGRDLLTLAGSGAGAALVGTAFPVSVTILVDAVIPENSDYLLLQITLALVAATSAKLAFQLTRDFVILRLETIAENRLQPALWDRLSDLKPAFFRRYRSGDLLHRLLAIARLNRQLIGAARRGILSGSFALINLGLMGIYSLELAKIFLVLTLIMVGIIIAFGWFLIRKRERLERLDGEIDGLNLELVNGVSKLRVAGAEKRAFAAWARRYGDRTRIQSQIRQIQDDLALLDEILPPLGLLLLLGFAVPLLNDGLSLGAFLGFAVAFGVFGGAMKDIGHALTEMLAILPLRARSRAILESPPECDRAKADPGSLRGAVSLEHVTFRYREDGPLILDDVSIRARPGEFVAIVGPSGSGKSTLLRLLLGFEIPHSGTVYYDGQDLAGLDIRAVRRQLGVVLQTIRISAGSILESITAGASVSLEAVWEAAGRAGLAAEIERLPMGIHTVIGEGGTTFSEGQKQRILLARALVRNPKILLMDEATSALDNRTQTVVTENLKQLNVTRIAIAHRLSTIQNADRIYVLEGGRVVQVGTFEKLMQEEGLFSRLATRQL